MKNRILTAIISTIILFGVACNEQKQQPADKTQAEATQEENADKGISQSPAIPGKLVFVIETAKFRIRIDSMADGSYRYTSWAVNKDMSAKPDLVIENGEVNWEGTMGGQRYSFHNGEYAYDCLTNTMGEDGSAPVILIISKGDKEIVNEDAKIVSQ